MRKEYLLFVPFIAKRSLNLNEIQREHQLTRPLDNIYVVFKNTWTFCGRKKKERNHLSYGIYHAFIYRWNAASKFMAVEFKMKVLSQEKGIAFDQLQHERKWTAHLALLCLRDMKTSASTLTEINHLHLSWLMHQLQETVRYLKPIANFW